MVKKFFKAVDASLLGVWSFGLKPLTLGFLMNAVICFDPFQGGPGLHGNYFHIVAIIDVTYHYIRVSFAGSYQTLSRQVGVELTLIDYDCIHEVGLGAHVCIR
jgi:hypothetical protein